MAASNDLFELIQSLSKSEKRYFKVIASLHAKEGTTKYLYLFDLINAQKEYDEERIRAAFAKKFTVRHFSAAKYYLYNAILRALHIYRTEGSVDVRITTALHQAMILFERKLFRQSEKMVARAREQAIENERWHLAVEAQFLEYRIEEQRGASPEQIDGLLARTFDNVALWTDKMEGWATYVRMLSRINTMGRPRNSEQLAVFGEVLKSRCGGTAPQAESPSGALYRLFSHAVFQHAGGDYRGACESYRRMLPMIRSSHFWAGHEDESVTPILYNICLLCVKSRDAELFHEYYPLLLERTVNSYGSVYYENHILALALRPDFHLAMGEYREALAASAELEQALAIGDDLLSVPQRAYMSMLLLSIHFGLGHHARCIEYLNAIIRMKPDGLPPHRYGMARIYQLMVHFELGDYDLLEHLLRSAHRFFVANRSGFRAEKVIIAFIKRALRSRNRSEWPGLFRSLLDEIVPLTDDPFESSFLNWIDVVSWLESKVIGQPYAEIRHERVWGRRELNAI